MTSISKLSELLQEIVDCTHSPNPTDKQRIDVAPGKHKRFQAAIHASRAALATHSGDGEGR